MTTAEPAALTWLSCRQAAAVLELTPSRVAQLRRESRLRAVQTPLGWLYDPEDLKRFSEARKELT